MLEENTAHKKKQEVYQYTRTDSKDEGIMKWESAQWFRIMESVGVSAERAQAVHLETASRVATLAANQLGAVISLIALGLLMRWACSLVSAAALHTSAHVP